MPRLLACNHCHILQRAPDPPEDIPRIPARLEWTSGEVYDYRDDEGELVLVPAYDPILEDFLTQHEHGASEMSILNGEVVRVWQVDQRTWDSVDGVRQIKNQIKETYGVWYEDRDHYRTGATECYNKHGNPTLESGCGDFMDDSKLIGKKVYRTDTSQGDITVPPQWRQYLCYQCPYFQSYVQVEVRRKQGMYKEILPTRRTTPRKRRKQKVLSYNEAAKRIKSNRSRGV